MAALAGCPGRGERGVGTGDGTRTETETGNGDRKTERTAEATEMTEDEPALDADDGRGEDVLVDQVGYRPGDAKAAVVRTDADTFDVVDAGSGSVVASGDLSDPIDDENSGDTVRRAEFGDLTDPGTYVVAVDGGSVASHRFAVGEDVYGRTLAELCRAYTLKRSNTAIDDDVTGLDVGPGHPQDAEAELFFTDEFREEGEMLDVSGGWYDAGDYGKYVPPAAVTVGQLLLAYERNPDVFEPGQLAVDAALADGESGGADGEGGGAGGDADGSDLPDLLAEVRFELEWLERMQRPDGAVYHKVAGTEWPGFVRPTADARDRYVFGLSTYGTAQYAGAMAMAARAYEEYDAAFAERALANAESAWEYLEAHPEPHFRRDEGQDGGSGAYEKPEGEGDAEERLWAAAELLRTTGEGRYADWIESEAADLLTSRPTPVTWADAKLLGQWAYYRADAADPEFRSAVGDALVEYADDVVAHVESDGYDVALATDDYHWASAKLAVAKGSVCLLADAVEGDERYRDAALDQVHYVLGRTPTGYSYVTGAGENPPRNTHDRIRASTGTYVPGYLVGGPNANGGDPALDGLIEAEDPAPAKCYVDERPSFASNEWAIDYSAPLVFALSHFASGAGVSVGE